MFQRSDQISVVYLKVLKKKKKNLENFWFLWNANNFRSCQFSLWSLLLFLLLIIKDEIIYSFLAASSKQRCLGKETKGGNKEAWVGKCSLKRRQRQVSNIGGCRGKEDEAIKGSGTKNSPEKWAERGDVGRGWPRGPWRGSSSPCNQAADFRPHTMKQCTRENEYKIQIIKIKQHRNLFLQQVEQVNGPCKIWSFETSIATCECLSQIAGQRASNLG